MYNPKQMNTPEGEAVGRKSEDDDQERLIDEKIEKEKPVVKSSTGEGPAEQEIEGDKPNLPPAMPPMA